MQTAARTTRDGRVGHRRGTLTCPEAPTSGSPPCPGRRVPRIPLVVPSPASGGIAEPERPEVPGRRPAGTSAGTRRRTRRSASSWIGFSETIVPRIIQAPVRISAPPSRKMVPPFICRPAKSRTGPPTAMMPRFIRMPTSMPGRALDEDRPAVHARQAAAIGGADLPAGVAADADQPAGHLGADPVGGVAGDLDRAALHVGAQVHAGVAVDRDAAARHAAADPLDPAGVAADFQLVAAVAFDLEEVVQRHCRLPRNDRQGAHARRAPAARSRPARGPPPPAGRAGCSLRVRTWSCVIAVGSTCRAGRPGVRCRSISTG